MRENNQLEEVERKEEVSVRKPYNVRERKIKEAAYRDRSGQNLRWNCMIRF